MDFVEFAANNSSNVDDLDTIDFDTAKVVINGIVKGMKDTFANDRSARIIKEMQNEVIHSNDRKTYKKLKEISRILQHTGSDIDRKGIQKIKGILKTMNIKTLNTMLWRFTNMDAIEYLKRKNLISETTQNQLYNNRKNLDVVSELSQLGFKKYKFNEILQKRTPSEIATMLDVLKQFEIVPPNVLKDVMEITQERMDA